MSDYLKYKNYLGTVSFNADDELFYGKVYGLNDLITFQGTSVAELKEAFIASVEDYLKTCSRLGKEPDRSFKGSFNVRVNSDLHRQAAFIAGKNQISLNDFVKKAIHYAIKHEGKVVG